MDFIYGSILNAVFSWLARSALLKNVVGNERGSLYKVAELVDDKQRIHYLFGASFDDLEDVFDAPELVSRLWQLGPRGRQSEHWYEIARVYEFPYARLILFLN